MTNNTAASYTSGNNARYVAAVGNIVNTVWYDERDGNREIYCKRSTDAGVSWSADSRLTNNSAASEYPSVSVFGSVVHVVWNEYRDGTYGEIYYKRSTDAGINWGADIRLTNNTAVSQYPSLSVYASFVHVVWQEGRDGNLEIYYKRSTDGGISWGADTRLTNNSALSFSASVSVSGSDVNVVWNDNRDGNYEIYFKHSSNGGTSWETDRRLTLNSANSEAPSVSANGSFVHVVWDDRRDFNNEIYYMLSTNSGTSWVSETRLTNDPGNSINPSVSVSGSFVHIAWTEFRSGNNEIYYKRSTDAGLYWDPELRLTNNSASSEKPSILVYGSALHVVWQDNRDGNNEIYHKRNPNGNTVGIVNIDSEIPGEFSLSQNYPNPFNPVTKIKFSLPESSIAKFVVYDALGREVESLVNEELSAGSYKIDWNAAKYSSGIYFYKLIAGNFTETKKMLMIK
jgi:hypothetical protein